MRIFCTLFFALAIGAPASAQLEASFSYGYRFGGSLPVWVDNSYGELRVNESDAFTGDVRYRVGGTTLTASYTRQSSAVDLVGSGFFDREKLFDANIEYITVGGCRGAYSNTGFNPFTCMELGVGLLTPQVADLLNEVKLSAKLSGGFNYFFTERVGLRMSLGLLTPLQFGSAGIFCGSGGCNIGVGSSSQIVQGDLSGGIVVRLSGGETAPSGNTQW